MKWYLHEIRVSTAIDISFCDENFMWSAQLPPFFFFLLLWSSVGCVEHVFNVMSNYKHYSENCDTLNKTFIILFLTVGWPICLLSTVRDGNQDSFHQRYLSDDQPCAIPCSDRHGNLHSKSIAKSELTHLYSRGLSDNYKLQQNSHQNYQPPQLLTPCLCAPPPPLR